MIHLEGSVDMRGPLQLSAIPHFVGDDLDMAQTSPGPLPCVHLPEHDSKSVCSQVALRSYTVKLQNASYGVQIVGSGSTLD